MVVVPYRPWRNFTVRMAFILAFGAVGYGSYEYGSVQGIQMQGDAVAERDQLLQDVDQYSKEINRLRQELVNSEQAGQVDRKALEDVQLIIGNLNEKITQLEEDVLFYKQIMSPENTERGLVIGQLDLFATNDENRFQYKLVLKQQGNNDSAIDGYVNVNIQGKQNQETVSLPLRRVSTTESQLNIKLGFRYFQNVEGEMLLPADFVPEKVQIKAVAEGRNGKTVEKSFGWLVQN